MIDDCFLVLVNLHFALTIKSYKLPWTQLKKKFKPEIVTYDNAVKQYLKTLHKSKLTTLLKGLLNITMTYRVKVYTLDEMIRAILCARACDVVEGDAPRSLLAVDSSYSRY